MSNKKTFAAAAASERFDFKDAVVFKWNATGLKALLAGAVPPPQHIPETKPDGAWNKHMAHISRRLHKMAQTP